MYVCLFRYVCMYVCLCMCMYVCLFMYVLEEPVQSWTEDIPLLFLVNISGSKFENQSIESRVIKIRPGFWRPFKIFRATRKLILRTKVTDVTDVNAVYGEHMPLEFWK